MLIQRRFCLKPVRWLELKLIVETSRVRSFVRPFFNDIIENLWFPNFFEFYTKEC